MFSKRRVSIAQWHSATVTQCHISGRRLHLLRCESWKTPTPCFMGSWTKCIKWTHNDEGVFSGGITKLLNIRKMVGFFFARGVGSTCLHSWTATCLFTFMDSNALLQNSNFYITDINYYIDYAVTENVNHNDGIHTKHKLRSKADYRLWGRLLCRRSWFIFPYILAAVSKCFHSNFPSLLPAAIAATIKANGFVSHNYSPYVCLHSQLP
jgi:hypothetical protein